MLIKPAPKIFVYKFFQGHCFTCRNKSRITWCFFIDFR